MGSLNYLDWTIFAGYLAVVFVVGMWFARRQHSNEDYFVGGRSMFWLAVGMSLFATGFSSVSFLALPREAAFEDYHFLVTLLMIPLIVTPILWWLVVPLLIELKVTSLYEYLEIRFNRTLRRLGTLLFAGYAIGWMGSALYATGMILQSMLGLTAVQFNLMLVGLGAFAIFYTAVGGMQAVVWTDVLQGATLAGSMLILLLLAVGYVDGGWSSVWRIGWEHRKFDMFNMTLDFSQRRSFQAAMGFALCMYLPGYVASQVTVQRYVSVSNLRAARRALALNAVATPLVGLLFFVVGSTLFAYYNQPGATGLPEVGAGKVLQRADQILPHFVATVLPKVGLSGLLLAGLFAAAMSTIDSGINSLTAVVVYDWLSGRKLPVRVSRVLSVVFGAAVVGAALLAPLLAENVIGIITKIAGIFLGLLLGVFLLGMLAPRANTGGAFIGLAAAGACLAAAWAWSSIPLWWYGAVTTVPTFVVGLIASCAFAPPTRDQRRGLALWLQRRT